MAKTIIKSRYGVTPNDLLNNNNISLRAKGLFAYIQSKPEGWDFSVKNISSQCKEGRDAISVAVKELEDEGYLTRVKSHTSGGFWEIEYILNSEKSDKKTSDWKTSDWKTSDGKTVNGKTSNGKPVEQSNKELSKKEISKQEEDIAKDKPLPEVSSKIAEIIKAFEDIDAKNKNYYGNKTQRKACEFLLSTYGEEFVFRVIKGLNITNKMQYFPVITTPVQLQDKWTTLEALAQKYKSEKVKNKVAFS